MLSNKDAVANLAVKDLDIATNFYGNLLGLRRVYEEGKELIVFRAVIPPSMSTGRTMPARARPRL